MSGRIKKKKPKTNKMSGNPKFDLENLFSINIDLDIILKIPEHNRKVVSQCVIPQKIQFI